MQYYPALGRVKLHGRWELESAENKRPKVLVSAYLIRYIET
jgi:hypothetical protein